MFRRVRSAAGVGGVGEDGANKVVDVLVSVVELLFDIVVNDILATCGGCHAEHENGVSSRFRNRRNLRGTRERLASVRSGYVRDMVRTLARTARRLVRPASRPAALVLAWTHRYTVALWCRSIGAEVRQQIDDRKPNLSRSKRLLKSLWRVSSDSRLANAPELRRIAINDAGITIDAVETWQSRYLLDNRLGIGEQASR